VSSPPVALSRVSRIGPGRLRHVRARMISAGFLVLATSLLFLAAGDAALAQFPIRQVPNRPVGWPNARPASNPAADSPAASQAAPLPAVARIVVPEKDGVSYGSGTLIDSRGQFGLVVTNWHVVRDAAGQISVEFPDGFKSPAQVVKTDKDWDLAALSIYRPRATPLPVSSAAPQPGDELVIAGYGSGAWRMTSGRCTQYLAPGVEFPHELVELAAEARQGDSGGPILNQRGEVAGVLFGSGPGYTSGSYGGRVLKFLATVVPGGAPGSDGLSAGGLAANTLEKSPGAGDIYSSSPTPPPQATALHENKPTAGRGPDGIAMTPALRPTPNGILSPPPRREWDEQFGRVGDSSTPDEVDPRVAVFPSRLDFNSSPLDGGSAPFAASSKAGPSAFAGNDDSSPAQVNLQDSPPSELLAIIWQRVGGTTLFDQTKTVLAMIGSLTIVIVFLRFGSQKEREHEEE
jgi:serine protease Do